MMLTRTRSSRGAKARCALAAALVLSAGPMSGCKCSSDAPSSSTAASASASAGPAPVEIGASVAAPAPVPTTEAEKADAVEEGGCQKGMAKVGSFCIDRFEASLAFIDDKAPYPHYLAPPEGMDNLMAVSKPGIYPQGFMDRNMAERACQNAGKRLCTASEWQEACRGEAENKYPYGNEEDRILCNLDKRIVYKALFSKENPKDLTIDQLNDTRLATESGFLALTGQYEGCATKSGIFDMSGNLHEWVSDPGRRAGTATFAGAGLNDVGARGCAHTIDTKDSAYKDHSMGFRCCGADWDGKPAFIASAGGGPLRRGQGDGSASGPLDYKSLGSTIPKRAARVASGCPPGMAGVSETVCMDIYEAHLVDRSGNRFPYNKSPPDRADGLRAVSQEGAKPQGHISQVASARACANAGKRLCSIDEWRAAFGGNKYPYGDVFREGACNAGLVGTHPLVHFFPDTPHAKRPGSQYNDPRILDYVSLNAGGAFRECVSPLGIYDLGGNLSEWLDLVITKKDKQVHRLSEVLGRIDDMIAHKRDTQLRGYFACNRMVDAGKGGVWFWTNAHEPQ